MAASRRKKKFTVYVSDRNRETHHQFLDSVQVMDRSEFVMKAIAEKLARDAGAVLDDQRLRQVLREELAGLKLSTGKENQDAAFDDLADTILGGITF